VTRFLSFFRLSCSLSFAFLSHLVLAQAFISDLIPAVVNSFVVKTSTGSIEMFEWSDVVQFDRRSKQKFATSFEVDELLDALLNAVTAHLRANTDLPEEGRYVSGTDS